MKFLSKTRNLEGEDTVLVRYKLLKKQLKAMDAAAEAQAAGVANIRALAKRSPFTWAMP